MYAVLTLNYLTNYGYKASASALLFYYLIIFYLVYLFLLLMIIFAIIVIFWIVVLYNSMDIFTGTDRSI